MIQKRMGSPLTANFRVWSARLTGIQPVGGSGLRKLYRMSPSSDMAMSHRMRLAGPQKSGKKESLTRFTPDEYVVLDP